MLVLAAGDRVTMRYCRDTSERCVPRPDSNVSRGSHPSSPRILTIDRVARSCPARSLTKVISGAASHPAFARRARGKACAPRRHWKLGVATHVIGLTGASAFQYRPDRSAMIADVEPIAHVPTVSIDRQRLAGESVVQHQRDQFLRELPRAVIVRAVGGQCRKAIGVMVGTHQMIRRGLRRGVRTVGRVGARLANEERPARASRRPRRSSMHEANWRALINCQRLPVVRAPRRAE